MTKKIAKDRAVLSLLTFAMFLNSLTSFAQEPRVRVTEPIDNSALVRVPGLVAAGPAVALFVSI